MDKLFKFELGDVVVAKRHKKSRLFEGKITVRMNLALGNRYEYRPTDGFCMVEAEQDLILADHKPAWLRKGVKVQWLGKGSHCVYVVTQIRRTHPCSFVAERVLIGKDGNPAGKERMTFHCGAEDVRYWARSQVKKIKGS